MSLFEEHSGRDLAVNGGTRLSFAPFPHVEMTNAVISESNAAPGAPELAVSKLGIDLGFSGLLGRSDEIDRLVLEKPVLSLSADGRSQAEALLGLSELWPVGIKALPELTINEVLIRDGTVFVHSARRSKPRRFERVNAELSVPALTAPVSGKGQFNWKGKSVGFDFKLASPAIIAGQKAARLELAIAADIVSMRYEGDITTVPRLSGQGAFSAKTRSVRQFLAWLKGVSGAVPVSGEGEMMAAVSWTSDEVSLSNLRFEQENARGGGHAKFAFAEPRPRIEGTFVVDRLNLGPVLAPMGRESPSVEVATSLLAFGSEDSLGAKTTSGSVPTKPSMQVEQVVVPPPSPDEASRGPLLLTPGPGVSQPSLTISLPQADIDNVLTATTESAAAEPLFDADVDLDIRKAQLDGVRIGSSSVSLDFVDGKLKARLWQMAFYGGEGRGLLTARVGDPVPSFSGNIRFEEVDTRSLLRDALGVQRMGGKGRLTLNIAGRGSDWDSMALSLMGNGAFAVSDGAIDGITASALVSGLEAGTLDLRQDLNAVLPFGLLAGSFDVNHGLASTRNLRLRSPAVNVSADGNVNLARNEIDLLVRPGPVAKEQGGGVTSLAEHLPPLRIVGTLDSPRVSAANNPLSTGTGVSASDLILPGIVLRERRGTRRRNQLSGNGMAGGQTQQPNALAPSFSIAPRGNEQSPPVQIEPQR